MHPSSFGKPIRPPSRSLRSKTRPPPAKSCLAASSSRSLRSKTRPPPAKSCLAASSSDRDSSHSGEPCVRKSVHFPDDKFLVRVRSIPPRENRPKMKAIFKQGRIGEKKMFIMYTSDSMGSNQRFLRKLPRGYGRQYPSHSQWVSIVRARHIAAAYLSEPRSPRFAPSSNGSVPEPAFDGSLHGSVFDMSSLKDALPEPASPGSLHGSAFDMSSMLHALPDPDPTFDMGPLMDALPDPNGAFNMRSLSDALSESAPKPRGFASDMSSLMRALPNPDASSDVSSLVHVPKPVIAPRARKSRELPPKARRTRVVQTYVQVGPFSTTCFFSLCGVLLVLGPIFPQLLPAFYAALVLQFIYGTCFS